VAILQTLKISTDGVYSDKAVPQPTDSTAAADKPQAAEQPTNTKRAREGDDGGEPAAKKVDTKAQPVSADAS